MNVLQDWVQGLSLMQQSVLLTAIRGPDGVPKYHPVKNITRWYRRAVLLSSFARRPILNPWEGDGGSFYGPSASPDHGHEPRETIDALRAALDPVVQNYMRSLDELPHHFQLHQMHAAEIVGYKHPAEHVRMWWHEFYVRLAHDMHLFPETQEQMDARLSDSRMNWQT